MWYGTMWVSLHVFKKINKNHGVLWANKTRRIPKHSLGVSELYSIHEIQTGISSHLSQTWFVSLSLFILIAKGQLLIINIHVS